MGEHYDEYYEPGSGGSTREERHEQYMRHRRERLSQEASRLEEVLEHSPKWQAMLRRLAELEARLAQP